jgi:hypothetical protein
MLPFVPQLRRSGVDQQYHHWTVNPDPLHRLERQSRLYWSAAARSNVLVDQRIVIFMCHVQAVGLSCWLVN